MNPNLKLTFDAVGYASLFGGAFITLYIFLNILHHGYFYGVEPTVPVLVVETVLYVYATGFSVYLVAGWMWKTHLGFRKRRCDICGLPSAGNLCRGCRKFAEKHLTNP